MAIIYIYVCVCVCVCVYIYRLYIYIYRHTHFVDSEEEEEVWKLPKFFYAKPKIHTYTTFYLQKFRLDIVRFYPGYLTYITCIT